MPHLLIASTLGNVGKSTIGAAVVRPRFGGQILSVETTNSGAERYGEVVKTYSAEYYSLYLSDLLMAHGSNTITDLGSSNFDQFLTETKEIGGLSYFDYVIVPTEPDKKTQEDTITGLNLLFDAGLQPEQLRVVFNKVKPPLPKPGGSIEEQCVNIFTASDLNPGVRLNPRCYLPTLQLFGHLATFQLKWNEVTQDKTDYLSLLRQTIDQGMSTDRLKLAARQMAQKWMAQSEAIFDRLYQELDIGPALPKPQPAPSLTHSE
ncbi:hypothetical protein SAMN05446935_8024 [Burkholderia sp. YR290]|nr:hypothetical protein SAMN05446935_8024 [Burkholderia sp. YR290]